MWSPGHAQVSADYSQDWRGIASFGRKYQEMALKSGLKLSDGLSQIEGGGKVNQTTKLEGQV
jgi:hypothetical protein